MLLYTHSDARRKILMHGGRAYDPANRLYALVSRRRNTALHLRPSSAGTYGTEKGYPDFMGISMVIAAVGLVAAIIAVHNARLCPQACSSKQHNPAHNVQDRSRCLLRSDVYMSAKICREQWFEKMVVVFGQCIGNAATGLTLLRCIDPKTESSAGDAGGMGLFLFMPVAVCYGIGLLFMNTHRKIF